MKTKFSYFTLTAIAMSLTACSGGGSSNEEPPTGHVAIRFHAAQNSRSVSLEDKYTGFDVWAWKKMADNSEQRVMYRADGSPYVVDYTSPDWIYEGTAGQTLRYWDLSAASYDFTACSPHAGGSSGVIASVDDTHHISLSGITAHSATATDWLIARYGRTNGSAVYDTDRLASTPSQIAQSALTADVPLVFHHLLSMIEYRVYSSTPSDAVITDVNITLKDGASVYTKADYAENHTGASAWNDTYLNWSSHTGASTTLLDIAPSPGISLTGAVDIKTSKLLADIYEIPQYLGNSGIGFTVTITTNKKIFTNDFVIEGSWNTNTKYIYFFVVDEDAEIILLEIHPAEWIPEDPLPGGTQENW